MFYGSYELNRLDITIIQCMIVIIQTPQLLLLLLFRHFRLLQDCNFRGHGSMTMGTKSYK